MEWKIVYVVMTYNSDREIYRSSFRHEAEKWIVDKFAKAAPNSGTAEFYIREVWTNVV